MFLFVVLLVVDLVKSETNICMDITNIPTLETVSIQDSDTESCSRVFKLDWNLCSNFTNILTDTHYIWSIQVTSNRKDGLLTAASTDHYVYVNLDSETRLPAIKHVNFLALTDIDIPILFWFESSSNKHLRFVFKSIATSQPQISITIEDRSPYVIRFNYDPSTETLSAPNVMVTWN